MKKHTVIQSVLLHLLPGFLIGAVYYSFVPTVAGWDYPTIMALILSAIIVLIPFELGVLWINKKQRNESNYQNVILNRENVTGKIQILWIVSIILVSGIIFALFEPISIFLRNTIFGFIPAGYQLDFGYDGGFEPITLWITYGVGFVVLAIIAPIVEELYFRGYLLPRIPLETKFSGMLHSFLFAVYHTWSPSMIVTRLFGFYPFVFAVQKKKNIYIVIIAHCIVNTIDFGVGIIVLLNL